MPFRRFLRFVAPNLVTAIGMSFGMLSLVASYEGRLVDAGWLIIWAVLVDRLDGLVARSLRATSEFGVQMDSFADAINFGIAPAFLVFVTLEDLPSLGFARGTGRAVLLVACGLWTLANVFRLAKFNVVTEDAPKTGPKVFFGVPTTLAAGVLVIWYLVLLEYGAPAGPLHGEFTGPRLLGDLTVPTSVWGYVPAAMIAGAFLMASNLAIPKLQGFASKPLTIVVLAFVLAGYACGFARVLPEFMAILPTSWLVVSLVWSQLSPTARGLTPPPVLPADPGPLRPEQDREREA